MTAPAESRAKKQVRITSGIRPEEYGSTGIVELLDWTACYSELFRRIHPWGLRCPKGCPDDRPYAHGYTASKYPRYKCQHCGAVYTILTGTPFSGTRLGARELVVFMRLWGIGAADHEIAKEVGLAAESVRQLRMRLIAHRKYGKATEEKEYV